MRTLWRLTLLFLFPSALGCGTGNDAARVPAGAGVALRQAGADAAPPRELVENPQYRSWAAFKKGTKVVHRSVTGADGSEAATTTTTTYTLLDLTDEQAVVEMRAVTRRYDGAVFNNPPETFKNPKRIPLPPGVNKSDFGKSVGVLGQGEETVRVGGKAYETTWHKGRDKNEAGEVVVQVWSSDAVPGGLVKSVTRIPAVGKTTTVELLEVKVP